MDIKKQARRALYQGALICDNPYTYGIGNFVEDRKWKEWHQEFQRLREEFKKSPAPEQEQNNVQND